MKSVSRPLWNNCVARPRRTAGTDLDVRISRALASPPVVVHRALLERAGRHIDPEPWLCKDLAGPCLALFFPVCGPGNKIRRGTTVALALLYDTDLEQTIYAHPIFAGPDAYSLPNGPEGLMAWPNPRESVNADLAARRFMEHQRALWMRFEEDRTSIGRARASQRWRDGFHWALVRLYYCDDCDGCRWRCVLSEGRGIHQTLEHIDRPSMRTLTSQDTRFLIDSIAGNDLWKLEIEQLRRSGLVVMDQPEILRHLDRRFAFLFFATNVEFVQAGSIVGVAVYYDKSTDRVRYVHALTAGPGADPLVLFGDRELGLPPIVAEAKLKETKQAYVEWRRTAWSRFWLDELDSGPYRASRHWIESHTSFLRRLVEGGSLAAPAGQLGAQEPVSLT